ncbi:MAG: cofactor assembly of complex C subunit B [Cyanobacteria bacterium J06598_3]
MFFSDPARSSTLVLTGLMVVGLAFFIRASTKDRIEVMQFGSQQKADALRQAVIKYFYSRAYRPASDDNEAPPPPKKAGPTIIDGMTLVGMVSPSLFMAIFLSALAGVGFACLGLITATLFPAWGGVLLALVLASPLAGVFYWKKSSRPETIVLRVDEQTVAQGVEQKADSQQPVLSKLVIKGHRDELAELQAAFSEPELQAWAGLQIWEAAE